ncbi:hypothetical protein C1634_022805 [Chryseobacterium viscerum]|uniref:Uncharacterized protein n=1 Tax=Chryseobacterium viscerum TaxID=1037377 RepID=A0A316WE80_9FLAO|nr:hypothetical protein C1634_022805 [Chryseobacterium viscerum]
MQSQDLNKTNLEDFLVSLSEILDRTSSEDNKVQELRKIIASRNNDYYTLQSIFDFLCSISFTADLNELEKCKNLFVTM